MSGSQPTNNQAVQFEQQQAAEADQKEALRQQRLQQGTDVINKLFDPQPVMANQTNTFDWSGFNPVASRVPATGATTYTGADLPAGYSVISEPGKTTPSVSGRAAPSGGIIGMNSNNTPIYGSSSAGGITGLNSNNTPIYSPGGGQTGGTTSASTYAVQGPDGKIYNKGDPLSYTTQVATGKTSGGFGDDFFNNYKQQYLNYYLPDEARQYQTAQRDLNYNLARAGTLNSSAAADKAGDLAYNDANAQATIQSNANQATGQLQQSVQDQKQSLINQLYSTEDPTLTANLAQSAANATKLVSPNLTPAAAFFTPALTAAGAAGQSYLYPNMYPGGGSATPGPTVTPAGQGSGKVQGGPY
jgi:type II secretory pathway pseudopilin PulG